MREKVIQLHSDNQKLLQQGQSQNGVVLCTVASSGHLRLNLSPSALHYHQTGSLHPSSTFQR